MPLFAIEFILDKSSLIDFSLNVPIDLRYSINSSTNPSSH
jgi:hypothetical protein